MQALNKEHRVLVLSSFYIPLSVSFAPGNLKTCSLNASEGRFYQPCSGVNTGCCLSKVTPSWGHSGNTVDLSVRTTPLVYPRTHCTNLTSWRHESRVCNSYNESMSEENWRKVTYKWNEESRLSFIRLSYRSLIRVCMCLCLQARL